MTTFSLTTLTKNLATHIAQTFSLSEEAVAASGLQLTITHEAGRGDLATNAAMVLARTLKQAPRAIAEKLVAELLKPDSPALSGGLESGPPLKAGEATSEYTLLSCITSAEIAGPGFINITLSPAAWCSLTHELATDAQNFFTTEHTTPASSYLLEFVSANPTGPLHLGHGRGAIVGDVLHRVLHFTGHKVHTEFYINDAGSQMKKLGNSLFIRCQQALGHDVALPEDGYQGSYITDLAQQCVDAHGADLLKKDLTFFTAFAHDAMLKEQEADLKNYGVVFDQWFSEKSLHASGAVDAALERLKENGYLYKKDGAWWFKSTEFGDDKDRVIRKEDGSLTYIAADIAYHVNKFSRGCKTLVNFLGQDHLRNRDGPGLRHRAVDQSHLPRGTRGHLQCS